ncbi:MAG: heparinase II/III family protein [Kiritimatiellae bacterium]|nr:heparinase II/III family protein [Kiritimatiellia bacterium]
MSKTRLFSALIVAAGVAASAGTVKIGEIEIPANSPLARGEHPRLLFTSGDLPRLRQRLTDPRIARELEWAKKLASEGKADAILLGVLYHLTEEPLYLEQARKKISRWWSQEYPLAADLVMASLSPEEQAKEAGHLVEVIQNNRWRPHLVHALAAWGHGHDEYLQKVFEASYKKDLVNGVGYNNRWSRNRGGSSMGHGYFGEHFYSEWFTMAVAWTHATSQDWVSKCDFAAHTPAWFIYHYRPWLSSPSVVHVGVTAMCSHWQATTPEKFSGDDLTVLAATTFKDGLGQWWVDNVISKVSMGWGKRGVGHGGVWGKLLWYDPELPAIPPERFPPARLFPENGHVVMRSDWTRDATYALFRCGRFGEIDGVWGRNNADNLHFIIAKKGILAPDTGAVHSLNNTSMGFAGNRHSEGVPHIVNYARQTIAHNSITVGREPIRHLAWNQKVLATTVRGGQSPIQEQAWWGPWGFDKKQTGFREGRIAAYETSPLFDYAAGDATHSYSPERVQSITRQFVYLRPDIFVVFDRVKAAKPGLETIWMLHSLYEPLWRGERRPDTSLPAEKQAVIAADGETRLPNPEPGGRYLHTGGDTFVIDDQWKGMSGRLFARILLPQPESRVVRTIGGKWHEFEVNGVNYGPAEATYVKHKGRASPDNRDNTLGVEGWRIEVSPKGAPQETFFLVVLHAADQTLADMPPVRAIRKGAQVGVALSADGKGYEVLFATAGPVGGTITIHEANRTLVDRSLADEVEDHYAKWRTDSRFREWTTNPFMKNVIGTLPGGGESTTECAGHHRTCSR